MSPLYRLCFLVLLCILSGPIAMQTQARAGVRLALVLGNSKYQAVPELDNPANDAADLAQALRGVGFEVIEESDATREAMAKAVHDFSERLRGADVALFFYAGHGMQMNGENYLLPVDAKIENPSDLRFNTINLGDIQQEMEEGAHGRANIIILDACRNNPFADKLARGGRGAPTRGLGRVDATGEGSLIVYSTQPNNVALDGAGRNSPFTSALLKYVGAPGLEIRQMISKVRGDVLQATGRRQTPWDSSSLVGDVYLADAPPTAASKPAEPPPPTSSAPVKPQVAALPAPAEPAPGDDAAPRDANAPQAPKNDCDRLAAPRIPYSSPDAVHEIKETDWARAAEACEAEVKANPGQVRFQYQLGRAYDKLKNYNLALHYYRIAAAAGLAEAQVDLGVAYYLGHGVVQNYQTAFDLFSKAAAAGSMRGLANVGSMYGDGRGVPKDDVKSLDYSEKAIEAGNPFGLVVVASHYFNGAGVARDYKMAAQYYQQAADLGDGKAMKFLANMYESGYLGPPDLEKAGALRLRAQEVDPASGEPEPRRLPMFRQGAVETAASSGPRRRYIVYRRVYRFGGCFYVCW
jgi:uncharacterized protein